MPDLPADQRALLAAVIAAPDDDTPRLVYADWLEDRGDQVQADYIRESVRLATLPADDPGREDLEERLRAAIREHSAGWFGARGPRPYSPARYYRRGFVHSVEFWTLADYLAHAPECFRAAPVQGLRLVFNADTIAPTDAAWWAENAGRWAEFVASPELGRLRSLTVSGLDATDEVWRQLFVNPALAGLREFEVWGRWTDDELEWLDQPHLAGLEALDLGGTAADRIPDGLWAMAGGHHFPALRTVYFDGSPDGGSAGVDPELAAALTERFGDRWGNRRPPPPAWC